MAEENVDNKAPEISPVQKIVQHAINKQPSELKNVLNKEIASRVMGKIDDKRAQVAKKLFGK